MSARDHISDYLLGELDAGEHARFEAALAGDPGLRADVERLRPVVERLEGLDSAAWAPPVAVSPPPLLASPVVAPPAPARRRRRRALVLRPLVAGGLAFALLALGLGAGVLVAQPGDNGGGRVLALAPVAPLGAGADGTATLAASGERAGIRLSGLAPSARGEHYELWLLNSADDLVALGSFTVPASGTAELSVPLPAGAEGFAALDVSVEPADGDPAHSNRSVLRAPLSS